MSGQSSVVNRTAGVLTTINVVFLIAGAVGLLTLHLHGARLLSVQTASMIPTFRPGDALVVLPVSPSNLNPGSIVCYHNPRNTNLTITHRLVSVDQRTGWLTTAGDARHTEDPSFPPSLIIGRANWLLPGFGWLLDVLRQPIGLALAIYLPALYLTGCEIRRLSHSYARPLYSARL
jgi:signal peptidase I